MLSTEELKEIDEEIHQNATTQGACIEAMKIDQRHRGWVSDEALRDISEHLKMSTDQLDAVATFYNLIFRKPVGRHVIYLCDSVSCWVRGCDSVKNALSRHLGIDYGETTADKNFTLLPIQCLGTCDHAPAMMIDETTYRDVKPESVGNILDSHLSKK